MPPVTTNKITATGKVGPGLTETAIVYNNVLGLNFDYETMILFITYNYPNTKIAEYDLNSAATLTYTISSGVATVVVSS